MTTQIRPATYTFGDSEVAARRLALLGWPRVVAAQGTWSVISLPHQSGEIVAAGPLAVDTAGNLYVADWDYNAGNGRIQKRDAQGNWSVVAARGTALGQVNDPSALAVDPAGNLYVADDGWDGQNRHYRIQKRDPQGNWSVISTQGTALGQVNFAATITGGALAVDAAGNLYVADWGDSGGRIQRRDAQGHWSVIATYGSALGQIGTRSGLAVDGAGNLYVADTGNNRVQMYKPGP